MLAPAHCGYRFPAEWEAHAATWLTWPQNRETWPRNLVAAQQEFEVFARTIADVESVNILATGALGESLQRKFESNGRISIFPVPTNDCWIRDYGPTFVKNHDHDLVLGVDWKYDGWGEKYPPFAADQQAAAEILHTIQLERFEVDLIMEGGAIDSNGTVGLSSKHCLQQRNPNLSLAEIGSRMKMATGLSPIYFLDTVPIPGDDTDTHIDQVARFVTENDIVVSKSQRASLEKLSSEHEFAWVELPEPQPLKVFDDPLPASYTNFYFANEIVIVPQFDDPADSVALGIIQDLLPKRNVIGLPSRNLLVGLGSFHCLSQQQPA